MSKYIIEVGDAYAEYVFGKGDMLCLPVRINEFEDNWLNTNIPLTPYTEPDTEKIREEAYEKGKMDAYVEDSKNITMLKKEVEEAYQRGAEDMRKALRLLIDCDEDCLTNPDIFKAFGEGSYHAVVRKHPAMEIIEKIQAYKQEQEEQEKEEQIQVGDEVRNIENGWIAVVSNIDGECMTLMDANGALGDGYHVNRFTKTGRHFPEIAEVLQKMMEE